MSLRLPPRYFLASIALLLVLVGVYAASAARRTRQELLKQLEEKGLALGEALEISSRNAVRGNALMEEMIAQRLLDNARLIDQFLLARPWDSALLARAGEMNRLRRVELLDLDGRPYASPPAPDPRAMMHRMMGGAGTESDREAHRAMMTYMWGRRWSPSEGEAAPPAVRSRTFWEGTVFGVAMGARSFPGIIAIHADADYVLNFGKEIGVERQVEELGRQSGVAFIALLDARGVVLAHSDRTQVGRPAGDVDPAALGAGRTATRLVPAPGGREVFEVLKPVTLAGAAPGVLRIGLATDSMDRAWRRDRDSAILLGLAVLGLGIAGMAVIFFTQHRHLGEVRALEAEMARRERLATLGDMAATLAHEIRNPLNAVSMGLQRLRAEFQPGDAGDYQRLVGLVQAEVTRLNGIVEEFLALARPLSLTLTALRPSGLLSELAELLQAEAARVGVRLLVEASPDLPALRGDRDRLKQVLLNLGLNAIEAMPGGGTLSLGASAARGTLTLTVADTGSGIPADLLPRVFEPYVTTKARGLGLGLAIARRIAEAHGGRIEVENAPGKGSRFRVVLPLGGPPGG